MVEGAVKAAGQYSHAVIANGFVYVAGQGPMDPATGTMPDSFASQVRQTLRNLQIILKGAGADLKDVVKVNDSQVQIQFKYPFAPISIM